MPQPPRPKKIPHTITQLGHKRVDDYAWMKDDQWQAVLRDPKKIKKDVKSHLLLENAYTSAMLETTKSMQEAMFKEMKGRIKEDDSSLPAKDGQYEYYTRFELGAQHPILARRPYSARSLTDPIPSTDETRAKEIILLDESSRAKGHEYYETGDTGHTNDHSLFAWSEDTQGSEYYTIYVMDIASKTLLGKPIQSANGDFVFSPDSQYLFWTWRDENSRPAKIYRRPAKGGEDTLIYEEKDPGFFLGLGLMSDDSAIRNPYCQPRNV